MMCEGASLDEVRFFIHSSVIRHGWFVQGVEGKRPDGIPWAYTIGLSENFDHPELVLAGTEDWEQTARILNGMADHIRRGCPLTAGQRFAMPDETWAELVAVHFAQFDHGVFNSWTDYYRCIGPPYPQAHALQVWMPDGDMVRLDTARDVLGAAPPNRVARRQRSRRQVRRRQRPNH
jgi:hypothetical protein